MTAESPSPADRTNGQQNATFLIKKGTSLDVLKSCGPVELGDDVKTAAQLRALLVSKGETLENDQIVVQDGSPLKQEEEGSVQWSGIVADEVVLLA